MWHQQRKARHAAQRNGNNKYHAQVRQGAWSNVDQAVQATSTPRAIVSILAVDMAQTHTSREPANHGAEENCSGTSTKQKDEMHNPVRAHGRQVTPMRRKMEGTMLHTQAPSNPTCYRTPCPINT